MALKGMLLSLTLPFLLPIQFARADVQDYCAAVARDFADLRQADRDLWQRRYDDAERDCIEDFAPSATAARESQAAKPRKALAMVKAKAKPQAKSAAEGKPKAKKAVDGADVATAADATAASAVQSDKPKLVAGSAAWLDYCGRKYASFDRSKGTYVSKTGVERKCLVTADFK